jgi:hypothetical protein
MRECTGQFFHLRITLPLVALAEPRSPLHQGNQQGETDKNDHGSMQPKFYFCANHILPFNVYRLTRQDKAVVLFLKRLVGGEAGKIYPDLRSNAQNLHICCP